MNSKEQVVVKATLEKADPRTKALVQRCPLCITRQVHDCDVVNENLRHAKENGAF